MERLEAEVIQHQQIRAQEGLKAAFVTAIRASAVELAQQFVGIGEEHIVALATRFVRQRLCQMRLADAGGDNVKRPAIISN